MSQATPVVTAAISRRATLKDLNLQAFTAGVVASLFGCVATSIIIVNAANEAGLTAAQSASWLAAVWICGGAVGVHMAWTTRQPMSGAWCIPAAVMLGGALKLFPFEQAVGAYLLGGVLILAIGASGLIDTIMRWIPTPVVMAMMAGALMKFATDVPQSFFKMPVVVGLTVVAYFLALRFMKRVSPVIPGLVVGVVAAFASNAIQADGVQAAYIAPSFTQPAFSFQSFVAISIPLAVLVLGAENAKSMAVLMAEGYTPPLRRMTMASGVGGIVASFFGGHSTNIAGPMTAICSSGAAGPDKQKRYMASVVNGVLCIAFGVVSSYAIAFLQVVPMPLIMAIAGLAMVTVLLQSLQIAFNKAQTAQLGAFAAFVISLSNITAFNITAPFWAIVVGIAVHLLTEERRPAGNAK